ncbi:hypothetical protein ACJX0J_016538, partial [Zea mays]
MASSPVIEFLKPHEDLLVYIWICDPKSCNFYIETATFAFRAEEDASFIRADDAAHFLDVIRAAEEANYLLMNSSLHTLRLTDSMPNVADLQNFRLAQICGLNIIGILDFSLFFFYLQEHPDLINDMLNAGQLHLVKPYMVAIQSNNVSAMNGALNELYLQKHELLEMRRIAAYIYKKADRWKQSIALSKKDNMYKDCMETCSQSGDRELSEDFLVYFIEQ